MKKFVSHSQSILAEKPQSTVQHTHLIQIVDCSAADRSSTPAPGESVQPLVQHSRPLGAHMPNHPASSSAAWQATRKWQQHH